MPGSRRILVINPNSSSRVTALIDREIAPLRQGCSFQLDVCDNQDGPPGIALQRDSDLVAHHVLSIIAREQADAYVLACFSDPGLAAAREAPGRPIILGCGESAILHALMLGDQFGIVALSDSAVQRQRRMVRMMGLGGRYIGSYPVQATAEETTSPALFDRMEQAAQVLAGKGANVIILGCAGMAHFRSSLEDSLRIPVIDPTRSAVAMAIGLCVMKSV